MAFDGRTDCQLGGKMKRKVHYTKLLIPLNSNPIKLFGLIEKMKVSFNTNVPIDTTSSIQNSGHSNKYSYKYDNSRHSKMKISSASYTDVCC
jgi:hypothetical protein